MLRDQTANLAAIVDYRWGLALGGDELSEADLIELARAKLPLVRLRGRWVFLDADQLAKGLSFLERGGDGQLSAGEALRLVRLIPDGGPPLPVTAVDGTGWLADLLSGRAAQVLELLDPPAGLATVLRPYRASGVWAGCASWAGWSWGLPRRRHGARQDGAAAGEEAVPSRTGRGADTGRVPGVCPRQLAARDAARFTRLRPGAPRRAGVEPAHDLVLTTYSLVAATSSSWPRFVGPASCSTRPSR